jgi:ribosomal protein S18 acetylase RimI-like enzyme
MAELRPTIDRAWLERMGVSHPLDHAFALWDLARSPERIRFFSAVADDVPVGYLLVWLGHPTAPVVHWVGTDPAMAGLVRYLPPRPLVAIVPSEVRDSVVAARGPAEEYVSLALVRPFSPSAPAAPSPRGIRLLNRDDVGEIRTWARAQDDPLVASFPYYDPEVDKIWGAFEGSRLVGGVHAQVRLPNIWVLAGVYVQPSARRRGWGRALLTTAIESATAEAAPVGVYVREDRTEARALYAEFGFQPVGRKIWLDLGAGMAP